MEDNKFRDEWKKALDSAEATPSERVWATLESELITADNHRMRRQVIYYQRLAAALVVFAILLGSFGFYFGQNINQDPMATVIVPQPKELISPSINTPQTLAPVGMQAAALEPTVVVRGSETSAGYANTTKRRSASVMMRQSSLIIRDSDVTTVFADTSGQVTRGSIVADSVVMPSVTAVATLLQAPQTELRRVDATTKEVKEEEPIVEIPDLSASEESIVPARPKKNSDESLWAAMGFAAGNFNPGTLASNGATASLAGSNPPASGSAYAMSLLVGKRIGSHWLIQGGVSYLNQTSSSTSNLLATASGSKPQALDIYHLSSTTPGLNFSVTSPYTVNSTLEFVSIPLQAGYLVIDRKLGWQMNAGVSSDIFFRNSLVDQSGQSGNFTQGAGSDSPYRTFNWSGLFSTEVSYRIGKKYRVSVMPGMRYLFNSTLKSGTATNAYIADIGFRFRYILR